MYFLTTTRPTITTTTTSSSSSSSSSSSKVTYLALYPKVVLGLITGTLIFDQVKVTHFLKAWNRRRKQNLGVIAFDLKTSDLIDYVQGQRMSD